MRFTEVESVVTVFSDNYKHNLISISAHKFLINQTWFKAYNNNNKTSGLPSSILRANVS